jgi:hypothetical protein
MTTPGRELKAAMVEEALEALWRIGEDLGGRAQRLAPIEEGTLRGSMAVALIVNGTRFDGPGALAGAKAVARGTALAGRPVELDVEVSFNTVYAARQHEETEWEHPLEGQAKYLEQPFREQLPRYGAVLEVAVENAERRARS